MPALPAPGRPAHVVPDSTFVRVWYAAWPADTMPRVDLRLSLDGSGAARLDLDRVSEPATVVDVGEWRALGDGRIVVRLLENGTHARWGDSLTFRVDGVDLLSLAGDSARWGRDGVRFTPTRPDS